MAAFALLLGGAFGNVIDRLRLGAVFDYLNIAPFVGFLNFADLAIGAGLILLVADSLRERRPPANPPDADENGSPPPGAAAGTPGAIRTRAPGSGGRRSIH